MLNLKSMMAAAAASVLIAGSAVAQNTLTFGAVAPKTGGLAGGAAVTFWPNVQLWAHDVNARGGLNVGGTMHMVEIVEYDDQTNPGETIKAVQRLATRDKADFILAPYGTGLNIASAPIFDRYGYPMVTHTAISDQVEELSAKFPNMYFTLGGASGLAGGVVDVLIAMRDAGEIGSRVAMVNVADAFGIELAEVAAPQMEAAGFEIVYSTSYPLGTSDLSPVVKGAKAADPDAFVAWSYPPDTFGLTAQAKIEELDVKAFYTAVATAFPAYLGANGDSAEGVLGAGGVYADGAAFQDYASRHEEVTGAKPDYWASGMVYSSFQILEQAIEATGSTDKAVVSDYIASNSFDTVMGAISWDENNNNSSYWTVGQWQGGVFKGVASTGREGAVAAQPKQGW
ncbi:MAG: amino acid ABC transporter substrate-binding protein [Alphaproteobacteria bacterium]|jgi:branched-chain amino acid transport system substrate-binding protein